LNIYEAFELGNPWSYFFVVKIVLDWDAWATYFLQILQQCCSKMKHLIWKYLVQAKTAITHFPFPEIIYLFVPRIYMTFHQKIVNSPLI